MPLNSYDVKLGGELMIKYRRVIFISCMHVVSRATAREKLERNSKQIIYYFIPFDRQFKGTLAEWYEPTFPVANILR